jgi:hypothetical protein
MNLDFLKNPIILALIGGLLVSLYTYVDSRMISKNEKTKGEYCRVFIVSSLIFAILLPYYHIPKRIFKENIIPGPAPF